MKFKTTMFSCSFKYLVNIIKCVVVYSLSKIAECNVKHILGYVKLS